MTIVHHDEHILDRVAMAAMRLMMSSVKGSVSGPDARKPFDELMEKTPAVDGVTYEAAVIGGVPGWWCRPPNTPKTTAILYLHGGGYVVGSAGSYRNFVGQVAARAKVDAFVPDYTLAPEGPFPTAVQQARAAYEGLVQQGFMKISLAGDSAGGGLALVMLSSMSEKARAGDGVRPVCAVAISPWTDLSLSGASMATRAKADPLSTKASLGTMAAHYLGSHDRDDPLASPLFGDLAGLPPVRLHVGEDDVLLDDSVRYAERVERAGGICEAHVWKGMTHVFPSNVALLEGAREALDDIGDFLSSPNPFSGFATSVMSGMRC
jgi:monoterpene epsilon-lactone hydrolase